TVDASTRNRARESNEQSNTLSQSQWVKGGSTCCSKRSGDVSQSAEQSNDASNTADQTGASYVTVMSGGNFAAFRKGDVEQNSGNTVDTSTRNSAKQENTQSNTLEQTQSVRGDTCRCEDEWKPSCD